ncbi:MAG: AsmA-like C-terminal domain-containing protein [Desulfurivibrio sp.]|nr:AsmA-like C-terminal domain-containing protein [Desulfurivibrio sp.]
MFFRIRLIILGLLLFAALLALTLTLLLGTESVRREFARQLEQQLGRPIRVESLEAAWYPLPHLLLKEVTVEHPKFTLRMPRTQLHPGWSKLWRGRLRLGRLIMEEPLVSIDPANLAISTPPPFPPSVRVEIRHGQVVVAGYRGGALGVELAPLQLREVNGQVSVKNQRLAVDLTADPSFGSELRLTGWLTPDGGHELALNGRALHPDQVVRGFDGGRIATLETTTNLKLTSSGRDIKHFTVNLLGEMPCLLLAPEDERVRLDCGLVRLELQRRRDAWELRIPEMAFREPAMRLAGRISRRLPTSAAADGAAKPHWEIELTGRQLDVGAIREVVRTTLGHLPAVRKFQEIVLDGQARTASLRFAGSQSELRDFKKMQIEVEVASAEIRVPEIGLYLPWAAGELRIEDGIMQLRQVRARLGESRAREGRLDIGLLKELKEMQIDIIIDAALADIYPLLPELIADATFQRELQRFSDPSGRALGRLRIGPRRDDFEVEVEVEELKGKVHWQRLPWPLTLERGRAVISQHEVQWREVAGTIGPHRLAATSGRVAITPQAPFTLSRLQGSVDSGALLEHLRTYPELESLLAPLIDHADGRLEIKEATASGRWWQPQAWQYQLILSPRQLRWHSPLLATTIDSDGGRLQLAENSLQLSDIAGHLGNDPFQLKSANFTHQRFNDWRGELQLSGTLGPDTAAWLTARSWLPPALQPRPPLQIDQLVIKGDQPLHRFDLAGSLHAALDDDDQPLTAAFQATGRAGESTSFEIRLQQPRHQATIEGEWAANPAATAIPELTLSFDGVLAGDTVKRLLAAPPGRLEQLRGDFKLLLDPAAQAPLFTGELKATGLELSRQLWPRPPVLINTLQLRGTPEKVTVEELALTMAEGENIVVDGQLRPDPATGTKMALSLQSPRLSRSTLQRWRRSWQALELPASSRQTFPWPFHGELDFSLQKFKLDSAPPWDTPVTVVAKSPPLEWENLRGQLKLAAAGDLQAEIDGGVICCLETTGSWYADPAKGPNELRLNSVCPETSRFEEILPCFGIKQDVIIGDCQVEARLRGDPEHWQEGRITINSPEGGRIMRLRLLSRIFSVVNLTDILSGGISDLDKEGFAYQSLEFDGEIKEHVLRIERLVVRGEGLNLFVRGSVELTDYQADLLVLIAPLKTMDAIVGKIPVIGRLLGGRDATVFTIPVAVRGDLRKPAITVLPPEAVGEGMLNLVRNTLALPFNILSPILPGQPTADGKPLELEVPAAEPATAGDNGQKREQ